MNSERFHNKKNKRYKNTNYSFYIEGGLELLFKFLFSLSVGNDAAYIKMQLL